MTEDSQRRCGRLEPVSAAGQPAHEGLAKPLRQVRAARAALPFLLLGALPLLFIATLLVGRSRRGFLGLWAIPLLVAGLVATRCNKRVQPSSISACRVAVSAADKCR